MTCRRTKRLIPLYAGDDLRPQLARAVRAHIDACPACGKEIGEYRLALARIKAAAKDEARPDWGEGEWRALMARVAASAVEERHPTTILRPRWAAATVLGMSIGLAVLSMLFRDAAFGPGSVTPSSEPAAMDAARKQDVVAVTLVSPETGLQVVWFFNRNFEWKGDEN